MKQGNDFLTDMLDLGTAASAGDVIWRACRPTRVEELDGDVLLLVPFQAQKSSMAVAADLATDRKCYPIRVRAYGDQLHLVRSFQTMPARCLSCTTPCEPSPCA
jgi:alpha-D-xyloside xylohydrolase